MATTGLNGGNVSKSQIGSEHLTWYQTEDRVVITLLARHLKELNLDPNKLKVNWSTNKVIELLAEEETGQPARSFTIELSREISCEKSEAKITANKVELTLVKVDDGLGPIQWSSLLDSISGPEAAATDLATAVQTEAAAAAVSSNSDSVELKLSSGTTPSPTKPKPKKNWDQIVKEFEEGEGKDDQGDVNDVFKQLYAGADDATRRAMNKSYSESGGKTLSMNWGEVATANYRSDKDKSNDAKGESSDEDD